MHKFWSSQNVHYLSPNWLLRYVALPEIKDLQNALLTNDPKYHFKVV